jgi:O-antigen ligase
MYLMFSSLALSGYLGQAIEITSKAQSHSGLPLLLGGRPEWTATLSLMRHKPLGYGPGVAPTSGDLLVAKQGLSVTDLGLGGDYVNSYMFGGHFKLHSVIADFWVNFGLLGLLWALFALFITATAAVKALGRSADHALCSLIGVLATWFLLFGPILTNLPDIVFYLSVLLPICARPGRKLSAGAARCALGDEPGRAGRGRP